MRILKKCNRSGCYFRFLLQAPMVICNRRIQFQRHSVANSQKVQQKGLLFPLSVASADGKLGCNRRTRFQGRSVANSQKVQQKGLLFPLSVASADGKLQQKDSISKAYYWMFWIIISNAFPMVGQFRCHTFAHTFTHVLHAHKLHAPSSKTVAAQDQPCFNTPCSPHRGRRSP